MSLAISACGSSSKPVAGAGGDATFTYVTLRSIITNWDPALSANNEQIVYYRNLYETLTYYDAQRKQLVPSLATSWRASSDRRRWTFTLRKGVLFHTGNRMTSASVKAALGRTQKLGGGVSFMLGPIASMATPSPSTIVFSLKEPANLPLILSSNAAAYIYDTKVPGQTAKSLRHWLEQGH
ncbi:MAG: ABC transporter substrate-binding protein, partial [Conexibacter sp.]